MAKPQVTGWIKGNPLADRCGWYERKPKDHGARFMWWSGGAWSFEPQSWPKLSPLAGDKFRGLTKPAKG